MLRSGSWAPDLKIVTPTRTFDVHKSVICQASPFFQAACKNGWQEAKSGVIEIPENALVVEEILSYCYGTRDDGLHACTEQCNSHSPNSPCRTLDFDTLIAAQKVRLVTAASNEHVS
ncbi:hypothetical protein HII31_12871 [Pseudocercospora fuligena]|uniref:BTB domain-containing protein n=1 Tax=Pseudocercospora fuligena TaxID=685502 RepID=A0A8H6R609_9PEZI|nr:hypothetical protein HII31_12871 [Pseudocercospora fuligena]